MHAGRHAGRTIGQDAFDEAEIGVEKGLRLGALGRSLPAHVLVAQHRHRHLVELQIAAAGLHQLGNFGAVYGDEIVEVLGDVGVGRRGDGLGQVEKVKGTRRRQGGLHDGPVRVAAGALEFLERYRRPPLYRCLGDARRPFEGLTLGVLELEMRWRETESVQPLEEEAEPGGTAELAVGHDLEPDVLLPRDHPRDLGVEQGFVFGRRQPALLQGSAGILERPRPQQADHLGAEGRFAWRCGTHRGPRCFCGRAYSRAKR